MYETRRQPLLAPTAFARRVLSHLAVALVLIGGSVAIGMAGYMRLEHLSALDPANFRAMIETAVGEFPNFQVVATTLRSARTASINDWGAICWAGGEFFLAPTRETLEIWDRVGGGDSFASGLAYGFLAGKGPHYAVDCGAAHGALAMTTSGSTP